MGFSRQEYWSGVPCSPLGDLPDAGIKPASLISPALAGKLFATSATWEALWNHRAVYKSRLLLRTLLAEEVDTDPGTPALHMAARPHMWVLDTCSVGDQVSWVDLENIAGGESSGERTCILTKQALVQGFLALSHRPGLPEPPFQEPGVPPSAPWHIHLPPPSLDKGISSPGSPDADSHSGWWEGFMLCYAKSLQSCPTLCDPIDSSPPVSPIPGIFQARTLEWAAISFSNAWKWKVKVKSLSLVPLLATPWTAAYQAPPSMGFSRQEYWSGVPLPSPEKGL